MAMMESKWYVDACYDKGFRGSAHSIATDNWNQVEEFVWENVQKGFNCLIIEHETGERKYAFAEDFNENTVEPKDIIRDTKKDWRETECFLTHYCEYPIYEPAEGGYYYAGREAYETYRCTTKEEAIQQLAEMKSDLEADGFIVYEDSAYLPSKYIGEGESWKIEKVYGSHESGKQIYQ